jgi:nicotinamidase-related amidase/alkylated DNA repair dioxygenase AlkB/glutathione S-transferase
MFSFEPPALTSSKALIVVDFQNDFLEPNGAMPVTEPKGFMQRALDLAAAFRSSGYVVWVQSQFQEPRPVDSDQIVVLDSMPVLARLSRNRRQRTAAPPPLPTDGSEGAAADPEAFLSHEKPECLKPESSGVGVPAAVEAAMMSSDTVVIKSHYSAFQDTNILRALRAKMAMQVFICGSLANVGVYATALGAAGHGLSITIVEDCCGYRNEIRQMNAVKSLLDLTGCEIASASEVLEQITLIPSAAPSRASRPSSRRTPASRVTPDPPQEPAPENDVSRLSASPDIVRTMTGLRLASDSPTPAPAATSEPTTASSPTTGDAAAAAAAAAKVSTPSEKRETDGSASTDVPEVAGDTSIASASIAQLPKNPLTREESSESSGSQEQLTAKAPAETTGDTRPGKPLKEEAERAASEDSRPTELAAAKDSAKLSPLPSEKTCSNDPETALAEQSPPSLPLPPTMLHKELCAGDTDVLENLLPPELEENIFYTLKDEVQWKRMSHQGGEVPRLVAVQGEVADDGSMPVYRHPSDESPPLLPFSPTVLAIKAETEKHLGHPLNHVLIQHYRDGTDYISEHSDKTLDIVRNSYIANVSLGAERTMVLRTKRPDKDPSGATPPATTTAEGTAKRRIERARLPHNSLCRMGLQTNMKWLHSIRQDKRADRDKTAKELAYAGGRISLTFRRIGTFLDRDETIIWGQGAIGKTRADAQPVVNGQEPEAIEMLRAFGTENHSSSFDWDAHYGKGFNVLHIRAAPRFFASGDAVVDMRITMMLAEYGIGYAKGSMAQSAGSKDTDASNVTTDAHEVPAAVKFSDNDANKSTTYGSLAIMLYIDAVYGHGKPSNMPVDRAELAMRLTRFQTGLSLLDKWRRLSKQKPSLVGTDTDKQQKDASGTKDEAPVSPPAIDPLKPLRRDLATWEAYATAASGGLLAGSSPSLPDFAVWPVLHAMLQEHGEIVWTGADNLKKYYSTVKDRESTKKILAQALSREASKEG